MVGLRTNHPVDPSLLTLRTGDCKRTEKLAKDLAGGVDWQDSQPWTPPVKTPIFYPPRKNQQTRIPLEFDWSPFQPKRRAEYKPMPSWAPPIPDPEGDRLPDETVINMMTFDDRPPWLDTMPREDFAKVGYTQHHNNVVADNNGLDVAAMLAAAHRFWDEWDRERRKASRPPKLSTEGASHAPGPVSDSLASLRGRFCRNCFERLDDDTAPKVRYCSERCRNRGEYVRRHGQAGTISPGVDLSSLAVDGKRVGIDTDDLNFARLLVGVA